jgi:G protein-coupled receptor 107
MAATRFLCFFFLSSLLFVNSLIHHLHIRNDHRALFEIETYGFKVGGKMNITISNFHLSSSEKSSTHDKDQLKLGFLLRSSTTEVDTLKDYDEMSTNSICIFDQKRHENDAVIDLSATENIWKKSSSTSSPTSYGHVIQPHTAGLYTLIFARCKPSSESITMSFDLEVIFSNPGPNYLSAGDAPLPLMYLVLFLLYLLVLLLWLWILYQRKDKVNYIHLLMATVFVIKSFSLLTDSYRFYSISQTGDSGGWSTGSVVYYLFASLKGSLIFLVIILIGSGWSLVKPFLAHREKNLIWAVLCLQVLDNIAMIILEETSPGSIGWFNWRDILHVVDLLCCVAILYPIFWSIHHFRQAAETDGKIQDNLNKLQLFRQFYVMVLCYIYFTRVIVYLLVASVSCFFFCFFSYYLSQSHPYPPSCVLSCCCCVCTVGAILHAMAWTMRLRTWNSSLLCHHRIQVPTFSRIFLFQGHLTPHSLPNSQDVLSLNLAEL